MMNFTNFTTLQIRIFIAFGIALIAQIPKAKGCAQLLSPDKSLAGYCATTVPINNCSIFLPPGFQVAALGFDPLVNCQNHDRCYVAMGVDRGACDANFESELKSRCKKQWCKTILGVLTCTPGAYDVCRGAAEAAGAYVRTGGKDMFEKRQEQRAKELAQCGRAGYRAAYNEFEKPLTSDNWNQEIAAVSIRLGKGNNISAFNLREFRGNDGREKVAARLNFCVNPAPYEYMQQTAEESCELKGGDWCSLGSYCKAPSALCCPADQREKTCWIHGDMVTQCRSLNYRCPSGSFEP